MDYNHLAAYLPVFLVYFYAELIITISSFCILYFSTNYLRILYERNSSKGLKKADNEL